MPGYADCVRDRGREAIEPHVDRGRPDAMGNLVGTVEGEANYDVVAAHMDQIGVVVRHVDDDGVLELDALGGWDPRVLRAQRVTVHAEGGDLPGVIGSVPPHTLDEADLEAEASVDGGRIDLGLDADAVEERVSVGDPVSMDQSTTRVGGSSPGGRWRTASPPS